MNSSFCGRFISLPYLSSSISSPLGISGTLLTRGGNKKKKKNVHVSRAVFMESTVSNALKKLDQQLTCPVCLEHYTQPRTLPCLHSFCHKCLNDFSVEANHFIACPVCRQVIQQPDEGASGFQSAFLINNLLELYQVLEKISGSQQNSCENCRKEQATGYCKQCSVLLCQTCVDKHNGWAAFINHQILGIEDVAATVSKQVPLKEQPTMECSSHGKPLEVYCNTCDKLVCYLCTVKHHRDHECEAITDAFSRHQQQIVDGLQQVKQKMVAITDCVHGLENQERHFLEEVGIAKKEIEATVQQLMQLLKESERQLLRELDQVTGAYIDKISARKKEADISISQLKSCGDFAEEELRIGSQQEILVMKGQMVERMATVCSQMKVENLRPLEETRVKFVRSTSVFEACRCLGSLVRYGLFKTARYKTRFNLCSATSNVPLSAELVSCKISLVGYPTQVFNCNVQQVSPVTFEVYHPFKTAGPHLLRVQVGGSDILDTPIAINVMSRMLRQLFTGLPLSAIAITADDDLIVADCGKHCISIFDPTNGRKIRSFGQRGSGPLQFHYPRGVAVTEDGNIVVADSTNHRIQVLTAEGAYIATVGTKGSQPLQFDQLWDVAVNHNENIFTTDAGNNRVQVLNADLSYSHCFGSQGARPGEFNDPRGITIDAEGLVYVADYGNNRVQKFTLEGKLLAIINSKGEEGQLNRPQGLCVDNNDTLYVTERGSNTVSMFAITGKFLGYIGRCDGSSFKHPWSIAYDQTGRLYINDQNGVITF